MKINQKGITLVTLVITVILLIILAGVGITLAIDNEGLFGKAKEAVKEWNVAVGKDENAISNAFKTEEETDDLCVTLGHTGQTHDNGGKCTRCGAVYVTHTCGDWEQTTEATCTEAGIQTRTCSCGETETQNLPIALGHTGQVHDTGGKCTRCGAVYVAHTWGDWEQTTEATCTEAGIQTRTCSCGETETQNLPAALGHTGQTHNNGGKCTRCSTVYVAHTWGGWGQTTEATCTAAGVQTRTCSCGVTGTQNAPAATGHQYKAWQNEQSINGTHTLRCSCGATKTEKHSPVWYVEGKSKVCWPCGEIWFY